MAGRCDCAQACGCAFASSGSVTVSGSGDPGQPYLAALRRRNGNDNILVSFDTGDPNPGLAVYQKVRRPDTGALLPVAGDGSVTTPPAYLRNSGGAVIAAAGDGSVTIPGGGTPSYGDGLTLDGADLVPDTTDSSTWPIADLTGTPLAGSAANFGSFLGPLVRYSGGLSGMPDHTTIRAGSGATIEPDQLTTITTIQYTATTINHTITNPSASRRMMVHRDMVAVVNISCPTAGKCIVTLQERINGGIWTTARSMSWPVPTFGTQSIHYEGELTKSAAIIVAPGATHTVQLRVEMRPHPDATTNAVFMGASAAVELLGSTI